MCVCTYIIILKLCLHVKVVWENEGGVGDEKEVPHIVYISREKRPNYVHHHKCGAMNFLVNEFSHSSLFLSKYVRQIRPLQNWLILEISFH